MIQPIQVILVAFVLFALSRAHLRYKEGKIKTTEYSFWIVVWVSAIAAIIFPKSLDFISIMFGIGRPADLILYVAVIILFYLNFRSYVAMDTLNEKITHVVREVAIKREKKK